MPSRWILGSSGEASRPPRWYLARMRQTPLLLSVVALAALFLAAGCAGGGGSQEGRGHEEANHGGDHDGSHGGSAEVELRPEGDSGVSAIASFEDASDGVVVKLDVRGLPKPDTLYLSHVHHGTCSEEAEEREHADEGEASEHSEHAEHTEAGKEHEHGEEIEYPLNQVKSDSEGRGNEHHHAA